MDKSLAQLRFCTRVQEEVIARLEAYQAALEDVNGHYGECDGYANGYAAELSYLHFRRNVLDALIDSVERLRDVSGPVRRVLAFTRRSRSPHRVRKTRESLIHNDRPPE